jgi:hypothetical protein
VLERHRDAFGQDCTPNPDNILPPTPPCVGESAEDVVAAPLTRTPATKRMASHSSLIERERIVCATDMETQIAAEARGVTRKDIPWDTFRTIYLCDFSAEARPELTINSVKKKLAKVIGKSNYFGIDCARSFPTRFVSMVRFYMSLSHLLTC